MHIYVVISFCFYAVQKGYLKGLGWQFNHLPFKAILCFSGGGGVMRRIMSFSFFSPLNFCISIKLLSFCLTPCSSAWPKRKRPNSFKTLWISICVLRLWLDAQQVLEDFISAMRDFAGCVGFFFFKDFVRTWIDSYFPPSTPYSITWSWMCGGSLKILLKTE